MDNNKLSKKQDKYENKYYKRDGKEKCKQYLLIVHIKKKNKYKKQNENLNSREAIIESKTKIN